MKTIKFPLLILCIALVFNACKDKEPEPEIPNEEEEITTLKFTLTPSNGGQPVVFSFQDLDGDGGQDPVITEGVLDTNTSYEGSIELLNELEDPAEDITIEVRNESTDHQFFYETNMNNLMISYDDYDADNKPIGLKTMVSTKDSSTNTLKITLRHEPNKDGNRVSQGDITNAGGETDIEVSFNVRIQ